MTEDEAFDKASGQLRLAIGRVLKPLRMYGQDHYVDTATEELVSLSIQFHQRLEGVDDPYYINNDKLHY